VRSKKFSVLFRSKTFCQFCRGVESGIYDLLITIGDRVIAVAYEKKGDGWIVVSKIDIDTPKTEVVDDIVEYRDYEIEEEEKVYEFVTKLYGTLDEQ
ncbi:hypothetical protein, partial [Halococcus sp. AFM35]|uniref:hypothetical protein n=1 Tax=Halococcus sp. AFM35 TaxID=3421653 RepID=UPI003EBD68E5